MEQICNLTEPVDLDDRPSQIDFEYSKIECEWSGLYEEIENPTTSASFYLEKSFTYGDFFLMGFITLFILVEIVKIIWQNFVKK